MFGLLGVDRWSGGTYGFLLLVLVFTLLGWSEYTTLLDLRRRGALLAGWIVLSAGLILFWGSQLAGLIELPATWESRALLLWPLLPPITLIKALKQCDNTNRQRLLIIMRVYKTTDHPHT